MTIVTAEGMEKKPVTGGNIQPPSFLGDTQQCVTAREGTDVTITIELAPAGGAPTAICWRRGDQELVGERYRVSENNNTVLLNLHHVTRDDVGHYSLTAKNSAGEARRAIEIKVEDATSDVPVFLRRLSDLAVKVGTRTRFLVEIRSSSEVKVSWHRNDERVLEGERFHFVHEGNFFCVDVAPVVVEDGGRWTCMAEGAGGRASCSSNLNVLVPKAYKAPEFLEELQALLTEQGTVSLECKVVGVPTPVLHWYKDGKEIKAGDVFALTANPDDPTSLGTYTCEAVNCMGKAYSSSRVHVVGKGSREGSLKPADSMKPVGPPPVFKNELRNEKIKIGDTTTLACQVSVPPWPQSITWYNKEGRVEESEKYHVMADGLGGYMIEINHAEVVDEGEWKCVATSNEGVKGISTCSIFMTYPKNYRKPRFLESLKAILTDEGLVSFECKVVGFPTPQLRWFKDGQELKPGDVYQLTGTNSLGSYSCIAKNCMGEASSSAELTVEDIHNQLNEEERLQLFSTNQPPKFIMGLKSCEAKITEDFRFTVQVTVSPEPSISWYRDDEQVEETSRYSTSLEALGTCHLNIHCLEIIDQAEWKCVATNEFGHSVTSCFLKLIIPRHFKKPRFLECLRAILSEEGAVNLECKVIGVPQPVLKWYKDGEELKPGDIHRIISGEDGTCCLGTYTCEAYNCMGTVASSASLLGFEERLMKGAAQQNLDQGVGHMIARNPSLSTIHEERTSQMYDTPATELSTTMDERAEVSFSFDGKEVSVSLYETPDLTEEEALQVVEMYADQLSEHVSEHNIVELPPLRFMKETSNTGKLLMEAIVIDVTHDAFASAEDDLRTDADLEEFSITDDNGQQAPPLPQDVGEEDNAIFNKINTEFLERVLAPTVIYEEVEEPVAPKRPPRKKTEASQRARPDSDTFYSLSPVKGQSKEGDTFDSMSPIKGAHTPKDDGDHSDNFSDTAAYVSEQDSRPDSYASALGSSGEGRAFQIAAIEVQRADEPQSTKSSPPELVRNIEVDTGKKDVELQVAEVQQKQFTKEVEPKELISQPGSLKKKMRSVESGLGRSFEESTEDRVPGEPAGHKPERPARKGSKSRNERSIESGQGGSFEESGDDRTSSEASVSGPILEHRQTQMKTFSSEVGSIESHMKKIQEQKKVLRNDSNSEEGDGIKIAKPGEIKRSIGKERCVSIEVQTEGSLTRKLREPHRTISMEGKVSEDTEDTVEMTRKKQILTSSSVDLPTLQAAADMKSAAERGECLLVESLTRSLQDIQKGLASVEEQVKLQSESEPGSAKSSISVLEALTQPIQDSLALVEGHTTSFTLSEEHAPGKILETISQPIQEFQKGLALVEQQVEVEMGEESLLERTSVSILENVAHPVQELQRDIALIQQFTERRHDTSVAVEEDVSYQTVQCALQMITQSLHEVQRGILVLQQSIIYEDVGETTSQIDNASILETLSHPLHKLRQGLVEIEQQAVLKTAEESIGHTIIEAVAHPLQELQNVLEIVEQQTLMEISTLHATDLPSKTVLQTLVQPIDELQMRLTEIGQAFSIEIEPTEPLPRSISMLKKLQTCFKNLQHSVESISKIATSEVMSDKVVVHDMAKLNTVASLAKPLVQLQMCLTNMEICEFKSKGEHPLATQERAQSLDKLVAPLYEFQNQLTKVEKQILLGPTEKLASQSAHFITVQSLLQPVRYLKQNIDVIGEAMISGANESNFAVVENLVQPLQQFTETLIKIEQQAVLEAASKLTEDFRSLSNVKVLTHSIQNLQETFKKIDDENTLGGQEDPGVKAVSMMTELAQPFSQLKQGLVEALQATLLEESEDLLSKSTYAVSVELLVHPLAILQKVLVETEQQLVLAMKKAEIATVQSTEILLHPIQELQKGIISVQQHVTESAVDTPSLSVFESLVEPLQSLQMAVTVVAPKQSSLLILENMAETVEALQCGVSAIEKQVLLEAIQDSTRAGVTKLETLIGPLKELQKELILVEQKIQFEPEEELASEISSISALRSLVVPLQELQTGLIQTEHFAMKQDAKPTAVKAAEMLVEPIMELQRGINVIQQQAILQAETAVSRGFTILETLAQPLQELQRGLTIVEEQNVITLEEAPIFQKAASLAALERVTQSVQELYHAITTIERNFVVETELPLTELAGLSALREIAKPLLDLHKGLIQVEDHIFEPREKPVPDRASILTLEVIAKPLHDLTRGLSQVEKALVLEPSSEHAPGKVGVSALETLALPLKALQEGIVVFQHQTALATETTTVFQALDQPFHDMQKALAVIQRHVVMEPLVEPLTEKPYLHVLQTIAHSIEEIHRGIALGEKENILEILQEPVSEETAASVLETILHPLKELQENLAHVQHQDSLEAMAEQESSASKLMALAVPILELQRGLELIEESTFLEPGIKSMTAVAILQAVVKPIHEIHTALAQTQEQVVLEAQGISLSDTSHISLLKALINPIQQLQKNLAVVEHQTIFEPSEEPLPTRLDVSVLQKIAQPLEELHMNLVHVEQQILLEAGERSLSGEAGVSVLETLAHPIQELEKGIAFVQYQVALEAGEVEMSEKTSVSVLKTLARPLQELRQCLVQIEQQVVMEAREEPLSEKAELSVLKTLAQPIEEIQKSIAIIEQQAVYEPNVEALSEVKGTSILKTLAHPLHELQQNLVQIEQQVALEAKVQPVSEISLSALKDSAQPIYEIQKCIALVQQQAALEPREEEMSDQTNLSLLQTLAQPLEELQKGIAEIQQQVVLETMEEAVSENASISILQAVAKPIQQLLTGIALIQEHAVYEGGVESITDTTSVSDLQTLAQPVQEVLKAIAVVQQQAFVEHGDILSEKEDMSLLKTLAQPVEELHRALLQVEQQVTLESGVEKIPMENFSVLKTLAQPILELQRGIALVEKQAVLECAEGLISEEGNLSLLKTLAEPLQELQKGILIIQQELLEGPLSDEATNISDLSTFASTVDASQVLGVIRVEEQRALEGDVETLSDRTDPRELESAAFLQQALKQDIVIVHEQTALEGKISEFTTESAELQVALISHETDQGSAIVTEGHVLDAELAAETKGKEASVDLLGDLSDKEGKTRTDLNESTRAGDVSVAEEEEISEEENKKRLQIQEVEVVGHNINAEEETTLAKKEINSSYLEEEHEGKREENVVGPQKMGMVDEDESKKDKMGSTKQQEVEYQKSYQETKIEEKQLEGTDNKNEEHENVNRKKGEQNEAEDHKRRHQEEAEHMKPDKTENERQRTKEEAECTKKEKEGSEQTKKDVVEDEHKEIRDEDESRKKEQEVELKRKEQEEAEHKQKEQEEAELKKKEKEEAERKQKEQEEAELKKKEKDEAERKKKEKEEAERKQKEQVEAEINRREKEENDRKKEQKETELKEKRKEDDGKKEEKEFRKEEQEETQCNTKDIEESKLIKRKEESECENTEEVEVIAKKTEHSKTKQDVKLKIEEKEADKNIEKQETKYKNELLSDLLNKEEAPTSQKNVEQAEPISKTITVEQIESRQEREIMIENNYIKQKRRSDENSYNQAEGELESVFHITSENADSSEGTVPSPRQKRSRPVAENAKEDAAITTTNSLQNEQGKLSSGVQHSEVQWVAGGITQRTRSFDQKPWAEEETLSRQRQYDDSLESSETITCSSSSSTLTPTLHQQPRERTEETRRIVIKEKVQSGPRDARKKPTFATRLTDRSAAQGSRIKLTCSVLGSPEPVVEWLKDGLPLVGEQRYKTRCEDGLACLEVLNASTGDSAEFTCVARNRHGEASSSATLKVFAGFEPAPSPPTFTRPIKDSYRFSDDELILECRVRCHPPPKITWLKDGVLLQGSSRFQQSELTDGVCRLVISSPEATTDSGLYTCRAENSVWSDQISSTVHFAGRDSYATSKRSRGTSRVSRDARRPHMSSVLTDHVVPTGGTIALQVEVKGAPKLDVTWLRDKEPLHFLTPRFRTFEESGVYTLVMSNVTEKEAGFYTCRASNTYGHADTSATVGIVLPGSVRGGKPAMFINRPDTDMSVAVGEDISVSFRVTGDPKPKVTWMKGLRDITNSQRSLKETLDDYVRLTLKRALASDAGTYCILAKNVYGCDRAFFTVTIRQRARSLTPSLEWNSQETSNILQDIRDSIEMSRMKDVPGPVGGQPVVVDSGRNWVTLSWPKSEVRGSAPVLAYRVEAWILGGDGGARWIEMGVSPINTFDAFNLKPGTEYKFRVTPRNRYGWGESVVTTDPVTVGRKVELPEFTRILPGQLKALQGSSIRLECQVRGDPVPQVRWYRDGIELNDPRFVTNFDGLRACQLSIQELRDEDSGRYMCEATNKVGRVSTFARLFVVSDPKILEADHKLKRGIQDDQDAVTDTPPQFTMRLRDRRVQMTYPVRLTCQVAGRPQPELTWSKDGEVVKQDDCHVFWSEESFHTLEMSHTRLEDSGCYSATARNANGAVSCRCHLVVDKGIRAYVAPEFLFELEPEHSVREGGELRLSAQVEAYPSVGVMWYRDGVRLRPSRRIVMTLNHDGTVELALAGISARDAGVYSCTATNEVGRADTSTRVNVQVMDAPPTTKLPTVIGPEIPYSKVPLFVTKPRSTEAVEGDTVIILCEVVGDPKPEVIWLRDWLKPDYYRDAPQFRRVGDGPQYRLEIPRAKLDFTGAYSVIARNCHGEAKAVISLQIYAKGQGKGDGMDHSSVKHGKVQTLPVVKRELKDLRCCDGDAVTLECCVQATPAPDIRWEKGGRLLPLGGDFSAEFDGDTARLHINQVYPEDEGEYTCVAYNELGRALTSACLVVDVPEEKETLLSRQLSRPPGLLSAGSTPRSTPRTTPSRSKSPSIPRHRDREGTPSRYTCEESRPRRLKAAAPKFYAVPHNRVAEEGETVRFQCAIAGHPTPWVTWDKDGLMVTPSARLTLSERDDLRILEISEVTAEDAGFYRITLENEVGRVEASARLEVIGHYNGRSRVVRAWSASPRTSPTFGRRLIGSAARVGGRLTLACDIRGSPTPASTWYRNGELVVRSSRVTPTWDGRTARLEIENLEMEDSGMYTCVAENEVGKTRCSARLVVLEKDDPSQEDRQPPVFLQGLPPGTVASDGDVLELQVRLQGSPPLDVVWVKDGLEIPDCEDFRYVDRGDGRFGLRLADVFPQDSGEYRCEAYNEHGDAVTRGVVSVREGSTSMQFSKKPTPVLASPGRTATFCARLQSSDSRAVVFWTVAGRPLDSSRHKVESDGDVHILHICPVELCDSGQVTCVARSGMSGGEECVARTELAVSDGDDRYDEVGQAAVLIRGPCDTTALRGDRVALKATYAGVPHPLVRWLKAGHELSSGGRVTITTEDGVSCLAIENITADDSGKYVVSVENSLGADCQFASVAVEGPADPPAGKPSVSGSGSSVNVAWCSAPYDGGCMVTGYCVEMRKQNETEWQLVTDRCHSLSYMVPGLTPGERYVFRVRAENAHGLSEASVESEPFQTGSDEESFVPVFEPRVVTVAPGEEFKTCYEVLEELGKGRYGVVHKVQERATGQKYAAKFIRCIKAKDREKVQEEIDVMNVLRHPKLLQLAAAFESPREVVMVLEYISGGELFERVVADDFTLTERDCILFMRQICEGVDYMHKNYIVHLDLKPENIMCHTRTSHQIKLIDFGLAQKISPDTPVRVLFGTPEFIPPEIINYEPIGVESDMWSVGVICYVLLSGLSPFMGDTDAETFANITRADYDFDDEAFDAISQDAKDFISALLVKRKEKRLTARECLHHTWLTQHDEKMSCVRLCTDKLKKFIIRRKWQLNIMLKRQTA